MTHFTTDQELKKKNGNGNGSSDCRVSTQLTSKKFALLADRSRNGSEENGQSG